MQRPERLLVRKLGREFLIATAEVEWIPAAGNYANLHRAERVYPLRSTINGLDAQADLARFTRIHGSYIVNLDAITAIEPLDSGDALIHLQTGHTLPCSRTYRQTQREHVESLAR